MREMETETESAKERERARAVLSVVVYLVCRDFFVFAFGSFAVGVFSCIFPSCNYDYVIALTVSLSFYQIDVTAILLNAGHRSKSLVASSLLLPFLLFLCCCCFF